MAVNYEDDSSDGEADQVEEQMSTISDGTQLEPGQADIRSYFRPLPKEDIRIYFKPVKGPKARPKRVDRSKPAVAAPKVEVKVEAKVEAKVQSKPTPGPIMSRPRPPVPPKATTPVPKIREIQERNPRSRNIYTEVDQMPRRTAQVVDRSPVPSERRPMYVSPHSPSSSGDDTLVNSSYGPPGPDDNIIYVPLQSLNLGPAIQQRQAPYRPDDVQSTRTYASSEALPAENRPNGASALQLWAQEQRRLNGSQPIAAAKKAPKTSRNPLRPRKKEKAVDGTKEMLEAYRQEELLLMRPVHNFDNFPSLPSTPTIANSVSPSIDLARGRQWAGSNLDTSSVTSVNRASSETLRQGKMVAMELVPHSRGPASIHSTAASENAASKQKKKNKLIRIMEAYSKNVEGIQMIQ